MMQRKLSPGSVYATVIIGLIFILTGCCKQPVQTLSVDKAPAAEQEMIAQKQSTAEKADAGPARDKPSPGDQGAADKKIKPEAPAADTRTLPAAYVVRKGDTLWWIAKYKDVYNDPYLWPVIYDANKSVIKDPDKIKPGMKLQIPRAGYKPADIQNARKTAGACKPYNPPARAVPPAD
jgi:LysM repeat protein